MVVYDDNAHACASTAAPVAEHFPTQERNELAVCPEVAAAQATWFGCQAVEPLEAKSLHSSGRSSLFSGDEVKCCADAEGKRWTDIRRVVSHPQLLLRHPETAPNDVGLG
jgi:hypothetical protein